MHDVWHVPLTTHFFVESLKILLYTLLYIHVTKILRPFDPLKQATFFFVIIHSIPHNALRCISMWIA